MMDLVTATHQILKEALPAIAPLGTGAVSKAGGIAAEGLWTWLKSKLTTAGAVEAVQMVELSPTNQTRLDLLRIQIQLAAEENAAFREELLKRCSELGGVHQTVQTAHATGGSTINQISGSGNNVNKR
jgi:hypothetical protein